MRTLTRPTALVCLLVLLSNMLYAQFDHLQANRELSFTTRIGDYKALHVNPANLSAVQRVRGVKSKKVTIGFADMNHILYSPTIKNSFFHKKEYLTEEEIGQDRLINRLLNGGITGLEDILQDPLMYNPDITLFGLAFHTKKAGSFALNIKTSLYGEAQLDEFGHELLFDGSFDHFLDTIVQVVTGNLDEDINQAMTLLSNNQIRFTLSHEANLGYSRKIIEKGKWRLDAGINLKYVIGHADMGLKFNEVEAIGYVSQLPFLNQDLPSVNIGDNANDPKSMGKGFGFSIGTNVSFKKKLRLGVSLNDVGSVKWPMFPILVRDDIDDELLSSGNIQQTIDGLVDEGIFYSGDKEVHEVALPTNIVVGASYDIHKFVSVYADMITPLNDVHRNLDGPVMGAGVQLSLFHIITVKSGAQLNNKNLALPTYVSFNLGKTGSYEIMVGSGDLLAFFDKEKKHVNANMGLFRFHF